MARWASPESKDKARRFCSAQPFLTRDRAQGTSECRPPSKAAQGNSFLLLSLQRDRQEGKEDLQGTELAFRSTVRG